MNFAAYLPILAQTEILSPDPSLNTEESIVMWATLYLILIIVSLIATIWVCTARHHRAVGFSILTVIIPFFTPLALVFFLPSLPPKVPAEPVSAPEPEVQPKP